MRLAERQIRTVMADHSFYSRKAASRQRSREIEKSYECNA